MPNTAPFHRLLPHASRDRADDREHVHRQAARQLRSAARLQPRGDGNPVFRAIREVLDLALGADGPAPVPPAAKSTAEPSSSKGAASDGSLRDRLPQRRKGPRKQSSPRACSDIGRGVGPNRRGDEAHAQALPRRTTCRRRRGADAARVCPRSEPAISSQSPRRAEGILARQREVKPLVELRVPFELDREQIDDVERGSNNSDWQPAKAAAQKIAYAEDRAMFEGYAAAQIEASAGDEQSDHDTPR